MNKKIKQFIKLAQITKLTDEEKQALHKNLLSFMETHTVIKKTTERQQYQRSAKPHKLLLSKLILRPMSIALIILLLVSGGTTYAAEQSLPGDILYPVKTQIVEEIRSGLALSDEAKAEWETKRIERRLEEITVLSEKNRLNEKITTKITNRLEKRIKSAEEYTNKLEEKGNIASATNIRTQLEEQLEKQESILGDKLQKIKDDQALESTKPYLNEIIKKINVAVNATSKKLIETKDKIETINSPELKEATENRLKKINTEVSKIEKMLSEKSEEFNEDTTKQLNDDLIRIKEIIVESEDKLSSKTSGRAFTSAQKAKQLIKDIGLELKKESEKDIDLKKVYKEYKVLPAYTIIVPVQEKDKPILEPREKDSANKDTKSALPLETEAQTSKIKLNLNAEDKETEISTSKEEAQINSDNSSDEYDKEIKFIKLESVEIE